MKYRNCNGLNFSDFFYPNRLTRPHDFYRLLRAVTVQYTQKVFVGAFLFI